MSKAREGCDTRALSRHSGVRSISLWPIRIHELDSVGCNRSRARSARASGRGRSTLGFAPFQDTRLRGEESPLTRSITLIFSQIFSWKMTCFSALLLVDYSGKCSNRRKNNAFHAARARPGCHVTRPPRSLSTYTSLELDGVTFQQRSSSTLVSRRAVSSRRLKKKPNFHAPPSDEALKNDAFDAFWSSLSSMYVVHHDFHRGTFRRGCAEL